MNKWILSLCLAAAGFAWLRSGPTSDGPPAERIAGDDLVTTIVDDGADVDLAAHVEPGVWTLFEYTADW